jgi:hypothetical protein
MMLVEFIEAIARISEKLNMPHFIIGGGPRDHDEFGSVKHHERPLW